MFNRKSTEEKAATREAVAELRTADRALKENSKREKEAGITTETPEYLRLNEDANKAAANVPWWRR